jgi:hypothetical protein
VEEDLEPVGGNRWAGVGGYVFNPSTSTAGLNASAT